MKLSLKQVDLVKLAEKIASKREGDPELMLLARIHELEDKTANLKQNIATFELETEKQLENVRLKQGPTGDQGEKGDTGPAGEDGIDGRNGINGINGINGRDGTNGLNGIDGIPGINGKDGSIKDLSPEEIRNALELLHGEDRLDISAIKGLEEWFKTKKAPVAIVAAQRGSVKAYDISSSLNGILNTFSLPAFWRVISVTASSFPFTFRPTVDYTTDGAAMTITFTSEILATSTLATGQSIIVVYAEP